MERHWTLKEHPEDEDLCILTFVSEDGATWSLEIGSSAAIRLGSDLICWADGQVFKGEGNL